MQSLARIFFLLSVISGLFLFFLIFYLGIFGSSIVIGMVIVGLSVATIAPVLAYRDIYRASAMSIGWNIIGIFVSWFLVYAAFFGSITM